MVAQVDHSRDQVAEVDHRRDRTIEVAHLRDQVTEVAHLRDQVTGVAHLRDRTAHVNHRGDHVTGVDRRRSWVSWPTGSPLTFLYVLLLVVCAATSGLAATDGSESKTAHACEDGLLVLKCEVGEVIRILRANYGRFTISVCNHHGQTEGWNLQCMSPKAKDIISERCDGRHECEMRISNHVFGDPCPSTSKYAEVKYACHLAAPETPHYKHITTVATLIQPVMILNGSPRPPHIISATALSPSKIEVKWFQPEPPSPIVTTAVYCKDVVMKSEPTVMYTNSESPFVIDQRRPNTSYSIFLRSINIHGLSMASNIINVSTPPMDIEETDNWLTSEKTNLVKPSLTDASTKDPVYSPSSSSRTTTTVTSTAQPTTHITQQTSSTAGLSADYYLPRVPEVSIHVNENNGADDVDEDGEADDDKDRNNANGVVDKICEQRNFRGVVWPPTRIGNIVEKICPDGLRGVARWRCVDYGWERSGPDFLDCTSPWLERMDTKVNKVMRGEEPADEAAVALKDIMSGQQFTSGDVRKLSIKLLPKLAKGFQRDDPILPISAKLQRMKKFKKAFVSTSSDLLSKRNVQSWRSLSLQDRRKAATSLLLSIEDVGFHASRLLSAGTSELTVDENIVMEVTVVNTQETHNDITFPSKDGLWQSYWETEAGSDSITIRSTSLKIVGMKGPVNIVFALYKNMEELMQPQSNTFSPMPTVLSASDGEDYYRTDTIWDTTAVAMGSGNGNMRVVNSKVISASINSTNPKRKLAEPVWFTLQHLEPVSNGRPLCSFWDMDTSYLSGQWSQEGCQLVDTNMTHTTCECDHLTNFAVLMDITGVKLSQENELALRVITFIGCAISVICLLLSWMTFLVFKNLQCDRNTIHKNLVFCLLLAEIVFLGGIAQTEPKILCSVIAGLLHYLFLSAFGWMCLEGVQLYIMLVEVFEQEKSRVHWYYLFGYGVPAIVVAVSAGVFHEGYGTDKHCWLTTDNYFIWSFVGPALAVMLINIVMLGIAVYTMCHHSIMSVTMRERSKVTKFSVMENLSNVKTFASPKLRFPDLPAWVKGAVVLVVLLGLTWLLGVLYLNEESVVIAYFFTVLNSLQGLFIFVFHCLKNEKVQKEYRKVVRRTSWLPDCIRIKYGRYAGMASNSHVASSDSRSYLSKLFGQKRSEPSTASTNSSARPFLSKGQERRSDAEHSTSKDSSNIPSSLNGYVYDPSYSAHANVQASSPFLNSNHGDGQRVVSDGGYEEVEDMAVDLSEYMDCSVVDSEFVSEYCQHNMQVCREDRSSSNASDGSNKRKFVNSSIDVRKKENSPRSAVSNTRNPLPYIPNSVVMPDQSSSTDLNTPRKDPAEHHLNLRQYVIPSSRTSSSNKDINISELLQKENHLNPRQCLTSSPVPSDASIPDTETASPRSSSPNLESRHGLSQSTSPSSENYMTEALGEPVYEEVRASPPTSSVPNLNSDGPLLEYGDQMYGHSSCVISSRC